MMKTSISIQDSENALKILSFGHGELNYIHGLSSEELETRFTQMI